MIPGTASVERSTAAAHVEGCPVASVNSVFHHLLLTVSHPSRNGDVVNHTMPLPPSVLPCLSSAFELDRYFLLWMPLGRSLKL